MAQNLKQYLEGRKCRAFVEKPHYFPDGDFVTYFISNERCYGVRLDELVTVYQSSVTNELVGCKIKSVKHLLETAGEFGVTVEDGVVKLGIFFFPGAARNDPSTKKYYQKLERIASVSLDRQELQPQRREMDSDQS